MTCELGGIFVFHIGTLVNPTSSAMRTTFPFVKFTLLIPLGSPLQFGVIFIFIYPTFLGQYNAIHDVNVWDPESGSFRNFSYTSDSVFQF